jgi:hypothetical protein
VLRGDRAEGEASALCPGCGSELSLLPSHQPAPSAPPIADSTTAPATSADDGERASDEGRARSAVGSASVPEIHPERLEQRRHLSWLRLGAVAVLLLVVATSYWGWQQRQRQRALVDLQSALGEGQAALDAGDVDRALEPLARAAQAASRLGATSGQGPYAQQLYREAVIWSDLPVTSIDDFFFRHAADAVSHSPDALVAAFKRDLAGRSIVVQGRISHITEVVLEPAAAEPNVRANDNQQPVGVAPRAAIALDWSIVGDEFHAEIASADLAVLAAAADREVIFGAELESLERDPRKPERWLVRLVPNSVLLLTAPGPFGYFNWPDYDSVEALLQQQHELVLPSSAVKPRKQAAE